MTLIPGYNISVHHQLEHEHPKLDAAKWTKHCQQWGGFDPGTKKFYKLSEENCGLWQPMDAIAAAVEAGYVDEQNWPTQLFASPKALNAFLEELSGYDECYRIRDRWYFAFLRLADVYDEEGFITGQEIADVLGDRAQELANA